MSCSNTALAEITTNMFHIDKANTTHSQV
uniref:Uncharacterized protein n=1 Tax=Anguilla anguilla TaxID=7936 RepID=A0A0E9T3E6_ANGAN